MEKGISKILYFIYYFDFIPNIVIIIFPYDIVNEGN